VAEHQVMSRLLGHHSHTNNLVSHHTVLGGFGVLKGVGKWNSIVEHLANCHGQW
jgi:hypothetical protein